MEHLLLFRIRKSTQTERMFSLAIMPAHTENIVETITATIHFRCNLTTTTAEARTAAKRTSISKVAEATALGQALRMLKWLQQFCSIVGSTLSL